MDGFCFFDSEKKLIEIDDSDGLNFYIYHDGKKIGEFNLDDTDEDGIHIWLMNITSAYQGLSIGSQLVKHLSDVYGKDIHQPFEKYKNEPSESNLPSLDSQSKKFINKQIRLGHLNKYHNFDINHANFDDEV